MNGYAIQQSTANRPLIFLLISSSDHISGATGKSPTVTISKDGGSFATPSGLVTEIGNGWYQVAANGTDSNTLGPLALHATASGCDPTDWLYNVVGYNPQSTTNLGLSAIPSAGPGSSGGLPTVDGSNGVKVSVGTGAGQINVASGKVPATMGSTDYSGNTVQTGDAYARIGSTGSGLTSLAPAATALSTANWTTTRAGYLDNLSGGAVALHSDATSLSTQIGTPMQVGNVTVGGYATGKDPASLVLDVAISGHETAGSVGAAIAAAGGSGDPWATTLPGSYTSGQAGYIIGHNIDATTSSRLASGNVTVGGYASNEDPATLVLGATASFWNTTGTIGHLINASGSASDPWTTSLPGSYSAGTAGYILGHNLDAAVSSRSTFAGGAVASVTGNVGGSVASVTAPVDVNLSQQLDAARNVGPVADTSLTLNDGFHCAIAAAAGKESVSGTTYLVQTPSTGTTLRSFTLDSGSAPTSRS